MRNRFSIVLLFLCELWCTGGAAQDYSNKGKDFWVAYGYHSRMRTTYNTVTGWDTINAQNMHLYFAAEKNAHVTVTIPGIGYTRTYNVMANTTLISDSIPKTGPQDVRLRDPSTGPEDKGIHITSDIPIVAYAQIYNQTASGTTLLYPTPVLSREYYSINFTNRMSSIFAGTGDGYANCWFYVIATEPGTTTVEITPSAPAIGHPAGVPFIVSLTQGQVYNVMGEFSNTPSTGYYLNGSDLTGSTIKSIASANSSCNKIAVFSGAGNAIIVCNNNDQIASGDNYIVQALPKNSWGKKYITVPSVGYEVWEGNTSSRLHHNWYRICVSDPSTVVKVNGSATNLPLVNNFYYEIRSSDEPLLIEADKLITVAQYFPTRVANCYIAEDGQGDGDPEVIYLSPVEQGTNKVLWNALSKGDIKPGRQYINVIIPSSGSAISSFKLDGNPVADTCFKPHPNAPGYSYAILHVSGIFGYNYPGVSHQVSSDSNFNAIAYGYGAAESYGYNAGTNIKDRYQFMTIHNQYAQVASPATCRNTPFKLSITLPYQPTQIKWFFGGLFPDIIINSPTHDSTWMVDERQLYRYTLPNTYTVPAAGSYTIRIEAQNPLPGQCTGLQELEFELTVLEKPIADFNYSAICITSPVSFIDTSRTEGRSITRWYWDFDDGNTSTSFNPTHTYTSAGPFSVKYGIITDIGCVSDTIAKTISLADAPVADFTTVASPHCPGEQISFADASPPPPAGTTLVKWIWNFGDGSPNFIAPNNASQIHIYNNPGIYEVSLIVESNTTCQSLVKKKQVVINKPPLAGFISPKACISDMGALFTDTSSVETGNIISWDWTFNDPNANAGNPNTSILQNPTHHFSVAGPYTVQLIVISDKGCKDTARNILFVNGDILVADFEVQQPASLCSNQPVAIKDESTVNIGNIIKVEIFWDAADLSVKTTDNNPTAGKIYSHSYPVFSSPASKIYTILYDVYSGTSCRASFSQTITVLAVPSLVFASIPPICLDAVPYQIIQATEINGMAGTGVFSGPGVSSTGVFDPAVAGEGLHTINFLFTSINGCTDQLDNTILVYPKIPADAGPDKLVLQGQGVMLTPVNNFTVPVTFLWTPSTSLDNNTILNPIASPPDDIIYTFTVISDKGCRSSDQLLVKVLKPISIPNIFSPNGDGIHDKWEIKNLEPYPGSVITIYNRYGQLVHRIINYSSAWDGKIKGKDVPAGTYYYIIEPKNGKAPISGYVDVIR